MWSRGLAVVAVEDCLDGGVAKLGLDEFEVLALVDQETREGVSQVVKTYILLPGQFWA